MPPTRHALGSSRPALAGTIAALLGLLSGAAVPDGPLQAQQVDPEVLSAMEARSIGPAGMSGRVAAIEGVPGDASTLYVGAATGGVWKSTDAGTTWEPIFDDQDASSIGAITVHPANPDLVWVGTGEANLRNSSGVGRGIYRSLDGGETWEKVGLEDSEHIHRIAVHPDDPDVAYVAATGPLWKGGGQRGVYRTTDRGETWTRVLSGPNPRTGAVEVVVDPENPLKLFASLWEFRRWPYFFESGGPGSGLYVSRDGGESWEEITHEDGLPKGMLGRIGVDVAPGDPSVVYALVEAKKSALYRSDDGGRTWRAVNREEGVAGRPFYYGRLMVDPQDPDRVYNIKGTLEVSTDGGRTFEGAATWGGGVHVDHHALWIDPEDPSFVVDGNDGGVYISRDRADTWRFVTNLPLSQFYEISVDRQMPYHVYGGLQDNGSWKGPAEVWERGGIRNYHWTEIGFGDGFGAISDPQEPRYGFSMSQQGYLNRYDLETGERKRIRPVPPADSVELRFNWNAPIALDPHRENTVYFGSQFLHRSTDDGLTWEIISPDLTTDEEAWQNQDESGGLTKDVTGAENYTTLYAVAPSPVREGVVWTGSDDGLIHVTRDGGETWTDVTDHLPGEAPDNAWVSHIEASDHDAATAFAVLHDYMRGDWGTYVYRTENYGEDWESIVEEGEVDGFARTLEQDGQVPGLLFLGTEFGLHVTLDGGESWFEWTHGLPTVPVRALTEAPENDLVIGTHGRGAYVLDDVTPLREMAGDPSIAERRLHLFDLHIALKHQVAPAKVYRFTGDAMFEGENEPFGAKLDYVANLPLTDTASAEGAGDEEREEEEASPTAEPGGPPPAEAPEKPAPRAEATIEIVQADSVIRTMEVHPDSGLNRTYWNFRREGFRMPRDEGGGPSGDAPRISGPRVPAGPYTVRLVAEGDTVTEEVKVYRGVGQATPTDGYEAKYAALMTVGRQVETATDAVERLRDTQSELEDVLSILERQAGDGEDGGEGGAEEADTASMAAAPADSLLEEGRALKETLEELEDAFVGSDDEEAQGITADEETVYSKLFDAYFALGSSDDAPTRAQRRLMRFARQELSGKLEEVNEAYEADVSDYRDRVREASLDFFEEWEPLEMPEIIEP